MAPSACRAGRRGPIGPAAHRMRWATVRGLPSSRQRRASTRRRMRREQSWVLPGSAPAVGRPWTPMVVRYECAAAPRIGAKYIGRTGRDRRRLGRRFVHRLALRWVRRRGSSRSPCSAANRRMSPGWHESASQIASSVEKRMARAFPVLRIERLASVMSDPIRELGQRHPPVVEDVVEHDDDRHVTPSLRGLRA